MANTATASDKETMVETVGQDPKAKSDKPQSLVEIIESPMLNEEGEASQEEIYQAAQNVAGNEELKELMELTRDKRDLEAQLNSKKKRIAILEPRVAEWMALNEYKSLKVNETTAVLHRELFASLVRDEDGTHTGAHKALQESGLGYLVKEDVATQSLKAYVKNADKTGEPIPEGALPFIKISEVFQVRVRT